MTTIPARREPPAFRPVEVMRVEPRSPRMTRVTLGGDALEGFEPGLPAASVRILLPEVSAGLVLPTWNGNEFLRADGSRPFIRTLTPLRFSSSRLELDVDVVDHGAGMLSEWSKSAKPGDQAALSGPGRGYEVDVEGRSFLVAGDECALPAIGELLRCLPTEAEVKVVVEVSDPRARLDLAPRPGVDVEWRESSSGGRPGDSLVAAVHAEEMDPDVRVWAAGEAAAMQRIRRHLFEEVGLARPHTVVRGYWKYGRERG